MAPPPSAAVSASLSTAVVSPVVALMVRILTFTCLLISVIILGTNSVTATDGIGGEVDLKFNVFYVYRYMLASAIIGIVYALLQTAFTIFQVSTGNRIGGDGLFQLDFYGDKGISYLLATGAAAGFGFTVDVNRAPGNDSSTEDFLNKANAAASLLLWDFCSLQFHLSFHPCLFQKVNEYIY